MEQRDGAGKDFVENFGGKVIDFLARSRLKIEDAWLIAADYAGGADAGDGHGESDAAGKVAPTGDGQNNGRSRDLVEFGWGNDENGSTALLFMAGRRIERYEVDIAALHRSSRPTAGASSHSRSEAGWVCE